MSAKYPRTFHLPWSPGGTSDDKRLKSVESLLGVPIIITEKMDGSNLTYTSDSVFSRSHSGPPAHESFNMAKATHSNISYKIPCFLSIFCEYCFAVHSITYDLLPAYSLVFGVRDDTISSWWSWDMVEMMADELSLPTVPVLFKGQVSTEKELKELTEELSSQQSAFGGVREGVVVRVAGEFMDSSKSLGKWVRKNHVQTDEHWMHKGVEVQRVK